MPRRLTALLLLALLPAMAAATPLRLAAAADLKFAMDEIVAKFAEVEPTTRVEPIYGSSGKFHAQIVNGAPYDLYFSADIAYPQELAAKGHAASAVIPYARGRIVLWSGKVEASRLTLDDLADPRFARIAIANPRHAPYGQRAEEALRAKGLWETLQPRLVFGENIAQTAQFVQSGNAQIGIIALSLALNPELGKRGGYYLIPEELHAPLEQGFVITRRGGERPEARRFADFMQGETARAILRHYGFALPGERIGD